MSRPRVFYILGSLEANDTGEEIVAILSRLSRARFEPRVIALGGREDLRGRIAEMKVRVYPLGLSGLLGTVWAVPKVRRLLKSMDARLVHGFGSWGGAVAQLAAPRRTVVVRSVTQPPNHDKDVRGRLLQMLERRARARPGCHFIVPNEGSRGLATRAYGAQDGRVTVLPTSVDVGGVRAAAERTDRQHARVLLGIAPDEVAFVLITNFEGATRMDAVLSGFATARREHAGLRMFILGTGRHESSSRWKAEELRLEDSVIFLGRGTETGPIWAAGDVAIDATPWSSWARPALVAISAGMPTLKHQDGADGWPEARETSFPSISSHPDRFAAELVRIAGDPEVREAVRRHGDGVTGAIDVSVVAQRLQAVYEEAMGVGRA